MPADLNRTPARPLDFLPPGSHQLAIAAGGNEGARMVHLVWVHDDTLYFAQSDGEVWTDATVLAAGAEPALSVGPDGTLHCVYANSFLGSRNIYWLARRKGRWALPQLISGTTGDSLHPTICAGSDGSLHVAWTDTTPGYPVIYYAVNSAERWSFAPIPNAKGTRPAIAVQEQTVYVAWQDRPAAAPDGSYAVFAATRSGEEWSLAELISDAPSHSLLPSIASQAPDQCHLVWQSEQNGQYVIQHADRRTSIPWSTPHEISDPGADARLGLALADRLGRLHVVWCEDAVLKHRMRDSGRDGAWRASEVVCEECSEIGELAASLAVDGELHVIYRRTNGEGVREYCYVRRETTEGSKVFLPVIGR